MNRFVLVVLVLALCVALAVPSAAQNSIVKSIYVVDAYNQGTADADGFHIVLNGVSSLNLDPDGYYDNGYLLRNTWDGSDGVHIDWTYGSTPKTDHDTFGFTVTGPIVFSGCQMYFTSGSTTVFTIEDLWQDTTISGSVVDTINNRAGSRGYVKRTGGRASNVMDANTLVGLTTAPLPITIDSALVPVDPGSSLSYNFSAYPGYRSYLMYYDQYNSQYVQRARFRTAAVLTPASLTFSPNVAIPDHFWWPAIPKTDNEMQSLTLSAGSGDDVFWTSLTLQPSGFGDDSMDILSINVWLDSNNNGKVDAGDQLLGSGSYWWDDYPTTIYLTSPPDIPANGSIKVLISYTMTTGAWPGSDYQFSLIDAAGTGGVSGADAAIAGLTLASAKTTMVANPVSIAAVKQQQSTGITQTFVNDKIVTGYFAGTGTDASDLIYIEEDNRNCGIVVVIPAQGTPAATVGCRISVNGVALAGYPETMLFADSWSPGSTPGITPKPIYLSNKATGGGVFGLQPAVLDNASSIPTTAARGLNNVGLLVKTSGTVTGAGQMGWNGATRDVVWIDDGAGLIDGLLTLTSQPSRGIAVILPSGMTVPGNGTHLSVTGIMSAATGPIRLLLPRTVSDLRQY